MKLPFRSTNRHITYEIPEEGNLDKSKYAKQSESQIWHDLQFMSHDVEVVFAGKYQNYIISYRVIKSAEGILE